MFLIWWCTLEPFVQHCLISFLWVCPIFFSPENCIKDSVFLNKRAWYKPSTYARAGHNFLVFFYYLFPNPPPQELVTEKWPAGLHHTSFYEVRVFYHCNRKVTNINISLPFLLSIALLLPQIKSWLIPVTFLDGKVYLDLWFQRVRVHKIRTEEVSKATEKTNWKLTSWTLSCKPQEQTQNAKVFKFSKLVSSDIPSSTRSRFLSLLRSMTNWGPGTQMARLQGISQSNYCCGFKKKAECSREYPGSYSLASSSSSGSLELTLIYLTGSMLLPSTLCLRLSLGCSSMAPCPHS